jgi:oxygen-dependent protoporphyrinogen oxidase
MRVVVVGGGIAGLAAAWELAARADVVVLEAADRVGGKLRLGTLAGLPVDVGAEAILARRPEGLDLAREAGLADELIDPLTTEAAIFAGGRSHPVPRRTVMGIPAETETVRGLLGEPALAAIDAEPSRPPLPPLDRDVSIGALVRDRLGPQIVDRLVEPLLGGVYAGRADALSLRATVPALAERLRSGGSLIEAVRDTIAVGTQGTSAGPVFAAVAGGVGRLPPALAADGRFEVRTAVTVRSIRRTPNGFTLECGAVPAPAVLEADAVVVATPAAKAATLLRNVAPGAAAALAEIESASVAIVSLAYRNVALPAGSGLLVAASEPYAVKGVTISSQKWPGTPTGLALLRASIGRAGEVRHLQASDAELVALVRRDLVGLLGVDTVPVDALVTRWGGGLPQYTVGHVERVRRIRAAVGPVPGLAVCGAIYDGIGIPACIASAREAARLLMSPGS